MTKNKNRRPQAPKFVQGPRNEAFALATITRHAASARPVPSGANYKRKPKHAKKGWDQ
jgi:hypothetical protein